MSWHFLPLDLGNRCPGIWQVSVKLIRYGAYWTGIENELGEHAFSFRQDAQNHSADVVILVSTAYGNRPQRLPVVSCSSRSFPYTPDGRQ
jgi:hypothetical protein